MDLVVASYKNRRKSPCEGKAAGFDTASSPSTDLIGPLRLFSLFHECGITAEKNSFFIIHSVWRLVVSLTHDSPKS
jgi:hypothetical protein